MQGKEPNSTERIGVVASEGEVPIESDSSFGEGVASEQVLDWDVGSLQVLGRSSFILASSCIEGPVIISIIDCKYSFAVEVEWLQHNGKALPDGKVSIECLYVVLSLIEAISIEDLNDFVDNNSSSFINVQVYLERVEVAGCNNNFAHPIVELVVVEFLVYGNSCEEGSVGKGQVNASKLFLKVNELNL